jgi:hypothetical protein
MEESRKTFQSYFLVRQGKEDRTIGKITDNWLK